jgi:hypothetical protein
MNAASRLRSGRGTGPSISGSWCVGRGSEQDQRYGHDRERPARQECRTEVSGGCQAQDDRPQDRTDAEAGVEQVEHQRRASAEGVGEHDVVTDVEPAEAQADEQDG